MIEYGLFRYHNNGTQSKIIIAKNLAQLPHHSGGRMNFRNPVGTDEIMQCIEHIAWRTEGSRHRKWLIATRQYIKTSRRVSEPTRRASRLTPVDWFATTNNPYQEDK